MKVFKTDDKIIIHNENEFNISQILDCGQVFSYYKKSQDCYIVVSMDKSAKIIFDDEKTIIETKYVDYFYNYFDLDTDYNKIREDLVKTYVGFEKFFLNGHSIRILKQDKFQTIISFIISANNNIKRIKKILNTICQNYGEILFDDVYSFPDIARLSKVTSLDYKKMGAGYRSEYLVNTIKKLQTKDFDLDYLSSLQTPLLRKKLLELDGVGPKVADCILFFGFSRSDVFPVDTWIRKGYKLFCLKNRSDKEISKYFISIFSNLSGFAQQYLFNYMITNKNLQK